MCGFSPGPGAHGPIRVGGSAFRPAASGRAACAAPGQWQVAEPESVNVAPVCGTKLQS
jgi:hypothetical protein